MLKTQKSTKTSPKFTLSSNLEIPKDVLKGFTANALKAAQLMKKDENINIRVSYSTKQALRDKAAKLGLRYQTLAGSILHQYAHA